MSRKDYSFFQLIQYFQKENIAGDFSWNLYSNINNNDEIVQEFMANAEYIKNARGKVSLYHEVLALQKNNLKLETQVQILQDLAQQYINKRAKEHLVYGVVHQDKEHIHMHLMISSNKIAGNKRQRFEKKEFKQIQKEIEHYKNQVYKNELKQTHFYEQAQKQTHEKLQEQEIKHRRKKQTKKEWIREQLEQSFNRSLSSEALKRSLESQGFEIYQRGQSMGVKFENKNYRFKTLGLEQKYKQTQTKFSKREQRQEKRTEFKQEHSQTQYQGR